MVNDIEETPSMSEKESGTRKRMKRNVFAQKLSIFKINL
jgi:hypothetical protein